MLPWYLQIMHSSDNEHFLPNDIPSNTQSVNVSVHCDVELIAHMRFTLSKHVRALHGLDTSE
jgi:hypothetical protein